MKNVIQRIRERRNRKAHTDAAGRVLHRHFPQEGEVAGERPASDASVTAVRHADKRNGQIVHCVIPLSDIKTISSAGEDGLIITLRDGRSAYYDCIVVEEIKQ